ncbi:MAG: hypothetical protein MJY97_11040 [Bacteroidales bacterium]|nr:hypothetical protein [Bacteroidales bacterium]
MVPWSGVLNSVSRLFQGLPGAIACRCLFTYYYHYNAILLKKLRDLAK